ncbi:putative nucleotide-binding protein [Rhodoligotrophos appendicifer]|uniref:TIR domain-containing protein n=1 Tax=Rhodoligotrophos appendicifer TaxID=987056 RepID=UPI00117DB620|nr:nucleotide-binding protein [Rhodoligotrophos appendicifer]
MDILWRRYDRVKAFDPEKISRTNPWAEVQALSAYIDDGLAQVFGQDTPEFLRYRAATDFLWQTNVNFPTPHEEIVSSLNECKEQSLRLLYAAMESVSDRIITAPADNTSASEQTMRSRKVFIVHGHDGHPREAVARLLERLHFQAIILMEQANQGSTIIEKIERYKDVGFAVVLLTPDDFGGKVGFNPASRPRQNVLLELGYFLGRLGRPLVFTLKAGEMDLPSDFAGVVWEDFDAGGGWKAKLCRELEAAGFDIDWKIAMKL